MKCFVFNFLTNQDSTVVTYWSFIYITNSLLVAASIAAFLFILLLGHWQQNCLLVLMIFLNIRKLNKENVGTDETITHLWHVSILRCQQLFG